MNIPRGARLMQVTWTCDAAGARNSIVFQTSVLFARSRCVPGGYLAGERLAVQKLGDAFAIERKDDLTIPDVGGRGPMDRQARFAARRLRLAKAQQVLERGLRRI
jgi:hypothetical protein